MNRLIKNNALNEITKKLIYYQQIFVYFMMTTLGNYRGMLGLIVAAIFAAALR